MQSDVLTVSAARNEISTKRKSRINTSGQTGLMRALIRDRSELFARQASDRCMSSSENPLRVDGNLIALRIVTPSRQISRAVVKSVARIFWREENSSSCPWGYALD